MIGAVTAVAVAWLAAAEPSVTAADPDAQIRAHLRRALDEARRRPADAIPATLEVARRTQLDRLEAYIDRGEFPRNDDHPDPLRPTFIDARGRICAVGYLIEQDLGRDAVEALARRFKYAFIRDIDAPIVDAWVATSGLTRRELERIQPSYPHPDTAAPVPAFGTLDRVDGESGFGVAVGLAADGRDGVPARVDGFGQWLWRRGPRHGHVEAWAIGVYAAAAASTGGGPDRFGNLDVGLVYAGERWPPGGRLILRAGVIAPTSSARSSATDLGDVAIGHRVSDAVLLGPPGVGARLGGSRLWVSGMPWSWTQLGDRAFVRVDAGVDVVAVTDGDLVAAPRAGVGVGVASNPLAILAEASTAWLPIEPGGAAALRSTLAVTLRWASRHRIVRHVQPGVTVAIPVWDDRTAWVAAFDLRVVVGPSTHDPAWYH
jgi:hypothetical protein